MKMHFLLATVAVGFLGCGSVTAQVGGGGSQLNAASPLAIGQGAPVAPTGIPLGATEMTMPGTSPALAPSAGCSGAGGPTSQNATPLFDGGGTGASVSNGCIGTQDASSAMPAQPTVQVGRAAIPLGSTELSNLGLSPPPPITTLVIPSISPSSTTSLSPIANTPPMATAPPCPVTGTFPDGVTLRQVRSSAATASIVPGC